MPVMPEPGAEGSPVHRQVESTLRVQSGCGRREVLVLFLLHPVQAAGTWARCLTALCLSLLICKMGIITRPPLGLLDQLPGL